MSNEKEEIVNCLERNTNNNVRKSSRERLSRFLDYFIGHTVNSAVLDLGDVPDNFDDIKYRNDSDKWMGALNEELKSMAKNRVSKMEFAPQNVKLIKSKFVFYYYLLFMNLDENDNKRRYKARLVVIRQIEIIRYFFEFIQYLSGFTVLIDLMKGFFLLGKF